MNRKVTLDSSHAKSGEQIMLDFPEYFSDLFSIIDGLEKDTIAVEGNKVISFTVHAMQQVFVPGIALSDGVKPKYGLYTYSGNVDPTERNKLDAFKYKKPVLKSGKKNFANKDNIQIIAEDKLRENYIPIHLTTIPVARPSNHVHELKRGLFCLVEAEEGKRETRFFPEGSVDASVFEQAREILGDHNSL